jgi:hypothetical protein
VKGQMLSALLAVFALGEEGTTADAVEAGDIVPVGAAAGEEENILAVVVFRGVGEEEEEEEDIAAAGCTGPSRKWDKSLLVGAGADRPEAADSGVEEQTC